MGAVISVITARCIIRVVTIPVRISSDRSQADIICTDIPVVAAIGRALTEAE